jgi:predicted protein tyrosine phosphatase
MSSFLGDMTTISGLRDLADPAGHSHILSILDPDWPEPTQFDRWPAARRIVLRFHDEISPMPGRSLPSLEDTRRILAYGRLLGDASQVEPVRLYVHCLSGVSRSAAAALMLWAQAAPDVAESDLFAILERVRPAAWPNSLMLAYADEVLGRGGRISSAATRYFRGRLAAEPGLEERMLRLRRQDDIATASAAGAGCSD